METSRLKQVYEFISEIVKRLEEKEWNEGTIELPKEVAGSHTKGQLYEARYILEEVENIIFRDK